MDLTRMSKTYPSRLIIFTAHFPFGNTETFLANEITFLSRTFDKILLVPCSYPKGNTRKRTLAPNIESFPPYLSSNIPLRILRAFFNKGPGIKFVEDFFSKGIIISINRFNSWINNFICCRTFLTSRANSVLISSLTRQDVLYFYWGVGSVSIIPFFKTKSKIVVRLHGSDAYSHLNGEYNYLPLRDQIYSRADLLLTISDGLRRYLSEKYNNTISVAKKTFVSRLGTIDYGINPCKTEKEIVIVSCSQFIPIKRIERIVESLSLIKNQAIVWHHFGEGILMDSIISLSSLMPYNISSVFHGHVDNTEILKFYTENHVDLFINVSSTEGIPVSIMEAMSGGIIPVATDVGDTRELVDQDCGYLLNVEFSVDQLASIISNVRDNDFENKRRKARLKWQSLYNAEVNYSRLSEILGVSLMA